MSYDHIPTITDLVFAGDPRLKAKAEYDYSVPSYIEELNMRIDDIESAIGQNESEPMGRAYAIRAENRSGDGSDTSIKYMYPELELSS